MYDFNTTNNWKNLITKINHKDIYANITRKAENAKKKIVFRRPLFKTKESDFTNFSNMDMVESNNMSKVLF